MADRLGQQLGNYRLLRLLGQGGFADVYLGQHIHLDSQAAIKVLQVRLTGSALEQFRGEGRALARLLHPNIVRVFDFGVENETPFLVMDFAPNGSLRQHYPKGTILSPATILPPLTQAARALQYAHDRKLIHRDVKPENMLLGPTNEVLLSDFGLVLHAQSTASQTTKEMAGTLPYMAPEQINGKPRPASDQYALGIVLYEWLSGDRPFHGSLIEIATQHLMTPPAPLYGKVPGMTRALQEVVFTALAKDFQQRFANMEAFAMAFEQACRAAPRSSLSLASGAASLPQTPLPPSASRIGLQGQSQQQPYLETFIGESQQPTYIHPLVSQSQQSPLITTPSNTPQPGSLNPPAVSSQEPTRTPTSSHLWPPSQDDPWPTFSVSASNRRAIGATHVQQPQTGEAQPPNVVTLPATTAPRLRILDTSGNTVRSIELTQPAYTLGRQDSNDLVLNEQGISQQHLRIEWDGQHVSITDLGSSNGTYLEGTRLIPQVSHDWQNRQMVGVGPYWLRLEGLDQALTMTARGALPTTPSAGTFTPPAQDTPAIVNSNRIGISINTRTLSIIPGQSTGVRVSLTNLGSTVDWFTTTVEGAPPNWVQGAGQEMELNPGMQETVDLTVNVARSPHNRAQDYPVLIRARSREKRQESNSVQAQWTVQPFHEGTLRLDPHRVTGRGSAVFNLEIQNSGNIVERYQLSGEDDEQKLRYDFESNPVELEPEGGERVGLRVGTRRHWIGREQRYPFQVHARIPGAGTPLSAPAEFVNKALLPAWVLTVILVAALLAGSAFAYATLFPPKTTRVLSATLSQSQTVATTGTKQVPASTATGKIWVYDLSDINLSYPAGTHLMGKSGVWVVTDAPLSIPVSNTNPVAVSVSAHAQAAGSQGNIPAYDINVNIVTGSTVSCPITQFNFLNTSSISAMVQKPNSSSLLNPQEPLVSAGGPAPAGGGYLVICNPQAFTGGQDAQTYSLVQQSDIDGATNSLLTQLRSDVQASLSRQMHSTEHVISAPHCTSNSSSSNQTGDTAQQVTVTVTMTCTASVST